MARPKGTRVTLTKGQIARSAGADILQLLVDITSDGELSIGELERLKTWLEANRGAAQDLPAVAWLSELVEAILADGRVTASERLDLVLAIERVLPHEQRLQAVAKREATAAVTAADEGDEDADDADEDDDEDLDPATEAQLDYIRALGGKPARDLRKGAASQLIDSLLASASSVSNRQMMVLRFWNRTEVARGGRRAVSEWMDSWYEADPHHHGAWQLWKRETGDSGHQENPKTVSLGIGYRYLKQVKRAESGGSNRAKAGSGCVLLLVAVVIGVVLWLL